MLLAAPVCLCAQQAEWEMGALDPDGQLSYELDTGWMISTNGVWVRFGDTILTADRVALNHDTGETEASGRVRIEYQGQVWVGEKIRYNFRTRRMQSEEFRTGSAPLLASGRELDADQTNKIYVATGARITTDDHEKPFPVLRARTLRVAPGDYIEARHATLYLGGVPVFYWPYYHKKIGRRQNQFLFLPGYRSAYGAYLLTGYRWYLDDYSDLAVHADYRTERGPGAGPEFNFDYGRWGEGGLLYYYAYDFDPGQDAYNNDLNPNRQLIDFGYQSEPVTNLFFKSVVSYESDQFVRKDFFESAYEDNQQPVTYGQARKAWDDVVVEAYASSRLNNYYDTVARLPEARLTVLPVGLGPLPLQYESVNSTGFYERSFAETNGVAPPGYDAGRADSFHQLSLPLTFFGWLNVIPRAGGRMSYYTEAHGDGATTQDAWRGVFNTGVEVTTKASALWEGVSSRFLELDGLRHIIQPGINYAYVPAPTRSPNELPQFDGVQPSFYPLPVSFPEYNSIDAIDARNVVRLGLRNKLQTKRAAGIETVVGWNLFIDWNLQDPDGAGRFSNLYSDLSLRPRSWLTLSAQCQLDVETGNLEQSLSELSLSPGTRWSIGLGHWYVREGFVPVGPTSPTSQTLQSRFYYRLSENWGFRMSHRFDMEASRLEEQYYTVYRDLRSFTLAVTFRMREPVGEPTDYTVALALSLKASPRYSVGEDSVRPSTLVGY